MTIHYNKLQADPKQGMSLDIGKLGQSSGVQGPPAPGPLCDTASAVRWSRFNFPDYAGPRGLEATSSGTLLPQDCPLWAWALTLPTGRAP